MRKDVFWNSIGTATWSFLSLFLLIIVTRVNGLEDSGIFSFGFAFALIMFTVACYGGRTYQVSDHNNVFSTNAYIALRLYTSLAVIAMSMIFILTNGYEFQKAVVILLLVLHRVFDAGSDVLYGIMQKKQHLYVAGKSLFFKSALSLLTFLAIDAATGSLLLSTLSLPLISLTFLVCYDIPHAKSLEKITIRAKFSGIDKILKSTFLPFAIAVMGLIFVNLARYFIDIYHPASQGHFGILIMPLSLVILLFSFILTPAVLHLSDSYHARRLTIMNQLVMKITATMVVASIPIYLATYFFGVPLLHLLFGVSFEPYVIDIILVITIGLAISLTSLFTNIAVIARKLYATAIIYTASIALLAFLCTLLVESYKIRGAIIAYVIVSVVQMLAMGAYYFYLLRHQRLSKNS